MRGRLGLALLAAGLLAGCTRAFFQPSKALFARPEAFGARYETVRFPSADGTGLTGLFFPSLASPALGTVVHFHGNAENMTSHFLYSSWLAERGFNVLAFDYRGYGASEGEPTVEGAVADGVAALAYARSRPEADPGRLAVFGQSLGAALAVAAVAESPDGVRAVVLESPFTSYRRAARDKLSESWLTWPLAWLPWLVVTDRMSPERFLARLPRAPLLVIHGVADRVVPFSQGRRLYELAREPKELWTVPGGGHTEAFARLGGEYKPRLAAFLKEAMK